MNDNPAHDKTLDEKTLNRRKMLEGLLVTGAALALSGVAGATAASATAAPTAAKPVKLAKAIEIADLEKLAKDLDAVPFELEGKVKALLVRVPAPSDKAEDVAALKADLESGRILEVSQKDKADKVSKLYLAAYTLVCTHRGCTVNAPDKEGTLICPCHGSRYAADGRVTGGPAQKDLPGIQLEVKEGKVLAVATLP